MRERNRFDIDVRRVVGLVVVLAVMVVGEGTASGAQGSDPAELVVLTFNIRGGRGPARAPAYDRAHLDLLVTMVNDLEPDVLLIQELDRGIARTGGFDQFAFLEEETGLEGRFAGTLDRGGGTYGIAMFSAYPIVDYRQIELPQLGGKEPRALQVATIEIVGRGRFDILHTHIDLRIEARLEQIELVLGHADELATGPAVLAGDFNAPDGSEDIRLITSTWTDAAARVESEPTLTYPTRDLRHRVDYVFYRGQELSLLDVEYPENPGISDHVPILARFEVTSVD
ncbi:MAG: endonuclease/exonuclease/phosphatase family protein [Spirochaetota bacterium]